MSDSAGRVIRSVFSGTFAFRSELLMAQFGFLCACVDMAHGSEREKAEEQLWGRINLFLCFEISMDPQGENTQSLKRLEESVFMLFDTLAITYPDKKGLILFSDMGERYPYCLVAATRIALSQSGCMVARKRKA